MRMAAAAAGHAMPLSRWSLFDASERVAAELKSFNRELSDLQLVMVPQVIQCRDSMMLPLFFDMPC
jgi:hypothetical protein